MSLSFFSFYVKNSFILRNEQILNFPSEKIFPYLFISEVSTIVHSSTRVVMAARFSNAFPHVEQTNLFSFPGNFHTHILSSQICFLLITIRQVTPRRHNLCRYIHQSFPNIPQAWRFRSFTCLEKKGSV